MTELSLRYGCNPHQQTARLLRRDNGPLPVRVLNGNPGYINMMDALNAWQLVTELRECTGLPAAASFKHVSPAGAAVGLPLDETDRAAFFVDPDLPLSPLACAYVRARGADRLSSYGDFAALSDVCDESTARCLLHEVSDGIIAPGYTDDALALLANKKHSHYLVMEMDPAYRPGQTEVREIFGLTLLQTRNDAPICEGVLDNIVTKNISLPPEAKRDLMLSLVTLKYTQSNSVCYVRGGQTVGVGAGQQSRIHCTRLAGDKADRWALRRHPRVLALPFLPDISRPARDNAVDLFISPEYADILAEGVWQTVFTEKPTPLSAEERAAWIAAQQGLSLGSDGFFPFGDNVERARKSGVRYIAEPGGSLRDREVIEAADRSGMVMCFTNLRLFHH